MEIVEADDKHRDDYVHNDIQFYKIKNTLTTHYPLTATRLIISTMSPHQQNEEDKEDVAEEEYGSKDPVGCLYLMEVEVTQDGSQQSEHSINEAVEVPHLRSQLYVQYSVLLQLISRGCI